MSSDPVVVSTPEGLHPETVAFYRSILEVLSAGGVPFLVGGAYAFNAYTGIDRQTKDIDLFLRRENFEQASEVLARAGYETELTYPHWLGKVHAGPVFVDLVFNSGNGITEVDEDWFRHAREAEVLGVPVKLVPVEEMLWSKIFIMERERYDGADVAHLLRTQAAALNWQRLMSRIERHWRVLLSHLVLFGFIYPAERALIPHWVMNELIERLRQETFAAPPSGDVCQGTLLSREQYLHDVRREGYDDGRATPFGTMSAEDIASWTEAIPDRTNPAPPPA